MNNTLFEALSVFAVLPVKNLEESVVWYTKLFGRAPDHQPAPGVADYYLSKSRNPSDGTLQLIIDTKRAGGGLVNINVADIHTIEQSFNHKDTHMDTVTIPVNAQETSSIIIGTILDPDGNAISIVQAN